MAELHALKLHDNKGFILLEDSLAFEDDFSEKISVKVKVINIKHENIIVQIFVLHYIKLQG